MNTVFIVGLPKSLRNRLESAFSKHEIYIKSILADIGRQGSFVLLPVGQDPIHAFNHFIDNCNEVDDVSIVVMPYAEIPADLIENILVAQELGIKVYFQSDENWPLLNRKHKPDTVFYNDIFDKLCDLFLCESVEDISISDYFQNLANQNKNILIHENVYRFCNNVSSLRVSFLKKSIDAINELILGEHNLSFDEYFSARGIEHAQSGGISINLKIIDHSGSVLLQYLQYKYTLKKRRQHQQIQCRKALLSSFFC